MFKHCKCYINKGTYVLSHKKQFLKVFFCINFAVGEYQTKIFYYNSLKCNGGVDCLEVISKNNVTSV